MDTYSIEEYYYLYTYIQAYRDGAAKHGAQVDAFDLRFIELAMESLEGCPCAREADERGQADAAMFYGQEGGVA